MARHCVIEVHDEVNVKLLGLDEYTTDKCTQALTYTVKNSHFMEKVRAGRWSGKISLFWKSGKTYRHLLYKILPFIKKAGYSVVIEDKRLDYKIEVPEIQNNLFEGYRYKRFQGIMEEHQVEAINTMTSHGCGILVLPTGSGKAQPLYSKILVPGGWNTMGEIKSGDDVIAADGSISKVTGIYPQGIQKIFRIHFEDGRTADCTDEHLWKIYNVFWPDDRYRVIPLLQLQKELECRTCKGYFVDLTIPPNDTDIVLPVDPYLLGVLLGDGGLRTCTSFSSADDYIVSKVQKILGDQYSVRKIENTGYDYRITYHEHHKNPLLFALRDLGLIGKYSYEKTVPASFMGASTRQRLELIRGLMDTDGETGNRKNMHLSFSTTSKALAEQMVELIRSVGGICKMPEPRITSYTHNGVKLQGRPSYRLSIRHNEPELLVSLPRKLAHIPSTYQYRGQWKLKITSIEEVGEGLCQCISIDHPSKLYVTDNYVVTHNTIVTAGLAQLYYQFGKIIIIVPRQDLAIETRDTIRAMGMPDCGAYFDEVKEPSYITVTTWQSLETRPELFQDVVSVIVDECHGASAKVIHELLTGPGKNASVRIGMTGTMPLDDLSKYKIMAALGPVIYEKRARELQEKGFLARCFIYILKYLDRKHPAYQEAKADHKYYTDEARWQWSYEPRLLHLADSIKAISESGNTLVLLRFRDYGEALHAAIPGSIYLNGDDKGTHRHRVYQEVNKSNNAVLICTYGIASTGIDVPRLFNLVLIEPGKESIPIVQSIGRGLRKADDKNSVTVYHVASDCKFSEKHVAEVQRIYRHHQYPFEVVEVDY